MKLAFVFGKNWQLSLAEILAWLEREQTKWQFIDLTKKALILSAELDARRVIKQLGGTLKIVRVEKEFDFKEIDKQDFAEYAGWPVSIYGSHLLLKDVKNTGLRTHAPP